MPASLWINQKFDSHLSELALLYQKTRTKNNVMIFKSVREIKRNILLVKHQTFKLKPTILTAHSTSTWMHPTKCMSAVNTKISNLYARAPKPNLPKFFVRVWTLYASTIFQQLCNTLVHILRWHATLRSIQFPFAVLKISPSILAVTQRRWNTSPTNQVKNHLDTCFCFYWFLLIITNDASLYHLLTRTITNAVRAALSSWN